MGYIKTRFNETVSYDSINSQVFFSALRNRYPIPSNRYSEVKYLTCHNNDCIVIEDVNTGLSENIGVIFKFQVANNANTFLCGGGCWTANQSTAGGHNYVFSFSQMVESSVRKFKYWSPTGRDIKNTDNTILTPEDNKTYWVNMWRKANDYTHCQVREPDPDFIRSLKKEDVQTSKSPDLVCGPLGFFNCPYYSIYYQKYGFAYSNYPTATANNYTMGYHSEDRKLFSNIVIYNPTTLAIRKFLYTCYKNSTHQYGLYDAVSNTFYGGAREMNVNNYWNNDDYYWENFETTSGNTNFEKECTFLNICGPIDQ